MFTLKSFEIVSIVLVLAIVLQVNAAATKKQPPKCLLPKEVGPCRMSLNRFYYNPVTDSCEEFVFGGCKGNDNKFGFKETCEAACMISTPTATPTVALNLNEKTLKSLTISSPVTVKADETTVATTTAKPQVTVKH